MPSGGRDHGSPQPRGPGAPGDERVEIGEPRGLWFRVRSRSAGMEHADLSRISPSGRAEFGPASPLFGAGAAQQPVPLMP